MKNSPHIGIQIPDILLPKPGVDLQKWAVIACDQFTSEPEYWQQVAELVGDSPSTLHMILPEVFLGTEEETRRIQSTQQTMHRYLSEGLFERREGFILVERTAGGKTRHGIMLALDLEQYDFNKGSQSLIRATEGTILERLPPRIRIRQGAPLELPHIIVLIDDPQGTVIEPLVEKKHQLGKLYDFELMLGSGHLTGYLVNDPELEKRVVQGFERLTDPQHFAEKYNISPSENVLLFAVGDGNHSLATAKSIWEQIKSQVGMDHPARYALVEIENVHDRGLEFEPIHRVLFNVKSDLQAALKAHFGDRYRFVHCNSVAEMTEKVEQTAGSEHVFGIITSQGAGIAYVNHPATNLPVGTLQSFLDEWLKQGGAEKIDYVHGEETTVRLGSQPGNAGFYLPAMPKSDLFKTVVLDGALPRKTFSMGEAREKRFYMECRKIV